MSTLRFVYVAEKQIPVTRIRGHAALVRALLDELERIAPPSQRGCDPPAEHYLLEQLADEIARLGRRLMECAAAMAVLTQGSTHGDGSGEPAGSGCAPAATSASSRSSPALSQASAARAPSPFGGR